MEPQIWGKHAWIFLHSITMTYPENPSNEDKKTYKNFFQSLDKILPCIICRVNYKKHINNVPIDNFLHSRRSLVEWLINIHNQTNTMLNKPTIEYDEVIDNFKKLYKKDDINNEEIAINNSKLNPTSNVNNSNLYLCIIMILLIIIAILVWNLIRI
jgi:hypothetical protein